jgi:hypothetical protein
MASENAGDQAHSAIATTVESAVRDSMHRLPWNQRGRPLNHHNKENPALVLTSQHSATVDAIANGDFSEELQKPNLNLHGDRAWLCGRAVKPRQRQFRRSIRSDLQGGLLFSDPTK